MNAVKQNGFNAWGIVLILIVTSGLGAIGYTLYSGVSERNAAVLESSKVAPEPKSPEADSTTNNDAE